MATMRHSDRLQTLIVATLPLGGALLATLAIVRGGNYMLLAGLLAGLGLMAVLLSARPADVFLLWLLAAPFVQALGTSRLEHLGRQALFSFPPLLFLVWTLLHRRATRGGLADLLPVAFLALVSASAYFTHYGTTATHVFNVVVIGMIVYYFCAFTPLDELFETRVIRVLLVAGIIVAVVVIAGKLGGSTFGYTIDTSSDVSRATGPFGDPAYLGTFLGIGIACALAVLFWGGPRGLRRLGAVAIVVSIPALFLTLTRGPMIAAGAVGLLIVLTRSRSRWPGAVGAAAGVLVVAALWGTIASTTLYKDRFSNTTNVQGRLLIDRWSFELAGRKPVFGWGYGGFDQVKNNANLSSGNVPRSWGLQYTSHNTFLTILVELGAVGLALLAGAWAWTAIGGLRLLARGREHAWVLVALLGTLGVWVINAGTFDMRFFPLAWVLPWLAVGLLRRRVLAEARGGPSA